MPKDIKDCVKIFDSKKGETKKADSKSVLKGKNESFVFHLPLYVKDHSNFQTNHFTTIHLVDQNGFFPGITPQDILKNSKNA